MKIEIELTEEQEKQLSDVKCSLIGQEFFVIPAQIKIPNWDNSMLKTKVVGRLLTGQDAKDISRLINNFMRERKEIDSDSQQKNIEL